MKKMLVKAVALSLVLGGVGFVANNAQAAGVPNNFELNMMLQNEAGQRKAKDTELEKKIDANAKDIATNKDNIADNKKIATKAYGMAQTEQVERKIADLQIREDMKKADKDLSDKIDKETNERKFGEFATNMKIKAEGEARVAGDELLNKKIEKEKEAREFGEFATNMKIKAEGEARVAGDKMLNGRIDTEIADRKAEVSRLDSRIDKLDANVEKVGAMAAAIANLHTMGYDPEAPTEIAVGVGQYRDKTGMALGAFHYPNRDFMLSFSVSTAGDEFMGGIGATWKFGRKSPEKLRQAEVEKAAKAKLAKAEAAKKAAKDARVAAQQKRHAEMLAARTGK